MIGSYFIDLLFISESTWICSEKNFKTVDLFLHLKYSAQLKEIKRKQG